MAFTTPKEYFDQLQGKLETSSKLAGLKANYQFNISGDDGGTWFVNIADGKGLVGEGAPEKSDCTLAVSAGDWMQIVNGKLNPQMAFMGGKIKIQGNMGLAMKLGAFLN